MLFLDLFHQGTLLETYMQKVNEHDLPDCKEITYENSDFKVLPTLKDNFPMLENLNEVDIAEQCQQVQGILSHAQDRW